MSLQVNFTTHGHDLKAAYEAILRPSDPKNGDNWVVFGYDKGSNDLKVLNQGNGGLEELQEEFVDGKIQYAFARVVDPYSQLNKFVLVAWCGDGVPESKKGLFNSHLSDVARFLSGFHLQINARCDADVTPALIMKKLDEGSGSKYSTHKENYQAERIQPLQSAYKRTEIPDISALQRNPTKPEPAPKYNIGTKPQGFPASSTSTPSNPTKVQGVWPPPASSSSSSSAPSPPSSNTAPERSWKSSVGSSYSAGSTANSFNKVQPPSSLSSYAQSAPEPVVNKAHQIRLEREAREKEERERIKREIAASEARSKQPETTSTAQRLADERRLQEEKEREREREREQEPPRNVGFNRVREERLAREKEERERAEAEDSARAAREAFKEREQSSIREQASAREEEQKRQIEQQQKREREAREEEERRAREQDDSRKRQQEEEARRRKEEEESRRRQQENEAHEEQESRLRQQQQEEEERQRQYEEEERQRQYEEEERQRQYEEEQEERRRQEEAEEQESRLQAQVGAATAQSVALGADALLASTNHPAHSDSVSAIVLYSYEKAEENEMTLFEGEIIRNVTELDVGWWSGESEDGTRTGLFPANYVEVIESSHEHAAAPGEEAAVVATEQDHHYQEHEEAHDHYAAEQHHEAAPEVHGSGQSAVALYDYQAGEPNEISFAEGETISSIDFVTDDWWSGTNTAGAKGLFPANYVELHS
ncbi:hypothetical protein BGX26_012084 [Mortierella sp. AD094]|nr:hypothetical protein BGX26_012084 [Mortierella sp. AD094]